MYYANAILDYTHSYDEVIAIGVNGYYESSSDKEPKIEYALYYLNRENLSIPKKIGDFKDLSCLSKEYLDDFMLKIDSINLSDEEKAKAIEELESDTESKLNTLNQFMHDSLSKY